MRKLIVLAICTALAGLGFGCKRAATTGGTTPAGETTIEEMEEGETKIETEVTEETTTPETTEVESPPE